MCGHPHPLHGGTMHTKALYQTAKALTRVGVAALRFNFRGVGASAGTFDAGPGEQDDFRAALTFAEAALPRAAAVGRRHVVRVVDRAVGRRRPIRACRCCWWWRRRSTATTSARSPPCTKPKFFVHGEEDELIAAKDIRKFYAPLLEPKELVLIEDANHLFEGKTSLVGDAVEELLADWKA